MSSLFERSAETLDRARSGDAFGPTPGAEPEPEPTALAAIALDDDAARRWLAGAQLPDGSFGLTAGPVAVDDRGNLIVWIDGQILGRELISLLEIDGMDFVGKADLLQHDRNFLSVRGAPSVEFYHN